MSEPKTLLIISVGELGTNVLEAAGRSGLFDRIIVASRSFEKAQARVNNALIGCGIDGFFPNFEALRLDINDPSSAGVLRRLAPDVVFAAPTLMPWWRIGGLDGSASTPAEQVPFGGFASLQLAPMSTLRARLADAGLQTCWIAASFPDVVNPSLARTGLAPTCGIGNVREPVSKIQSFVGRRLGVSAGDVEVRLVAQHAFEYAVFQAQPPSVLPPYLLEVMVHGQDCTHAAHAALREPFPFRYDLHFNRVTASAAIDAMRALLGNSPVRTHLPGVLGHVGGYPVVVAGAEISLDLAPSWSEAQATAMNQASLEWDGIERIDPDGTIVFTPQTVAALLGLTGECLTEVHPRNAAAQAETIIRALAAQ